MKTKLLFTLLLIATNYGYSQTFDNSAGYYINELIASISGTDSPDEYIELRGPASGTLPSGTYFITIEGDGESGNLGEVQEVLDLSGLSFGSNGYLTITFTGSSYATLLGTAASSDYTEAQVSGYDGDLLDYSGSYLLISASSDPDGVNVDSSPLDGEFDASGDHTSWNIYDSVSSLDDDGTSEYGYAQMNVATNYSTNPSIFNAPSGSSFISCDDTPGGGSTSNVYYIARQGVSTGYDVASDWMAGQTNSSSVRPNWVFSGTDSKNVPDALSGTTLPDSTFGGPNEDPTDDVLSTTDISASNFKISPNPANKFVNIESKNIKVSSVDIYNLLGSKVKSVSQLNDNKVNVENLSRGMYLLKINAEAKSITKKIIIE